MRGIVVALSFGSLLVCAGVAEAVPQIQTINPAADTFVAASNPGNNYGGAGALGVSATGQPQGEFQSVMRFDLAPVKAAFDSTFGAGNWQIASASLKLTAATPNNGIFNANAAGQFKIEWMQNDSWVEGTGNPNSPTTTGLTFNTLPSFLSAGDTALGTFAFPGGNSGSTTNALTLASSFAVDMSSGSQVSLHLLSADSAVSYLFNSRSGQTTTTRPELSVTADAIPEPASISTIAVAAGLLARTRRSLRV